jgi:serralysin
LDNYPDLTKAFGSDLHLSKKHWFEFGIKEKRNRKCSNMDDTEAKCYLARYPDLARAFGSDLNKAKSHWKSNGINEKRFKECDSSKMNDTEA